MAVTLDSTQWRMAVGEYAAASGKTFADSQNRFQIKLAFASLKRVSKANKAKIAKLVAEPKLIAWLLKRKTGGQKTVRATRTRGYRASSLKTRRERRVGRRKTRGRLVMYTADDAKKFARKHIARRKSAVGFAKHWFVRLAREFGAAASGKDRRGFKVVSKRATPKSKTAETVISFNFKSSLIDGPHAHASGMERILNRALKLGMRDAVRDTMAYVERKQREAARRYSAI